MDKDELRGLLIATAMGNTAQPIEGAAILLGAAGQILATALGNEKAAEFIMGAALDALMVTAPAGSA